MADGGITGTIIGAGISTIGGLFGGSRAASAAAEQARAQNRAAQARYQYDMEMWGMKKKQLQASRMEAVDRIITEATNEGKVRAYKDAANEQQYTYALQIRDSQQAANEAAFRRSDQIYTDTTDLNSLSAKAAMDSEIVKLEEAQKQLSFDRNEAYIESIMAEGKLRARNVSGRSAAKGVQATLADYGRQIEMLNEMETNSGRNTRAILDELIRDKTSADLVAYASKMLDPGVLPDPIKAAPIPIPDFDLPRALQEYDFGPQPVKGAMASPAAAASQAWGSAITSIASGIGGAVATGTAAKWGEP